MMAPQLTLILGGARSGKSTFASRLAAKHTGRVIFVATATILDEEMGRRIEKHRSERPADWLTVEAPSHLAEAVRHRLSAGDLVLVDCLTLMVFNLIVELAGDQLDEAVYDEAALQSALQAELTELVRLCRQAGASLIVVSNEVGLGLVPPYPLGRGYRDTLGYANQLLAGMAERVYFLVAGLPVELKALAAALAQAELDNEEAGD